MAAVFVLLTTCAFYLGHCAVVTTRPPDLYIYNEINAISTPQPLFSPHLRSVLVGIYEQNVDSFTDILRLSEMSRDINFRADVLLGLYDGMNKAHHTDLPFDALDLYNKIEALLNINSTSIQPEKFNELQQIRQGLLLDTIVPKGSRVMEAVVFISGCNIKGTPLEKLLEMLHMTNETVSNITFGVMVSKAREILSVKELVPILADLSPYLKQNFKLLISLYDKGPFNEAEKKIIFQYFAQLKKRQRQFKGEFTSEMQHKMNAIIPLEVQMQNEFSGKVCLFQKLTNGNRRYITDCSGWNYQLCAPESYESKRVAAFKVETTEKPLEFKFRSVVWPERLLGIIHLQEQPEYYQDNVRHTVDGSDWKVQFDGDQMVISSMNETKFLCAGVVNSPHTLDKENFLLGVNDCIWSFEDCSQYSK